MAGSYGHITADDGRFLGVHSLLDHMGDAFEALEECYGMIQWLAGGDRRRIEEARENYRAGLQIGGVVDPDDPDDYERALGIDEDGRED